jgi:hypothetical protein
VLGFGIDAQGVKVRCKAATEGGNLRTHAAANHSKRTGSRSVHAGPPGTIRTSAK